MAYDGAGRRPISADEVERRRKVCRQCAEQRMTMVACACEVGVGQSTLQSFFRRYGVDGCETYSDLVRHITGEHHIWYRRSEGETERQQAIIRQQARAGRSARDACKAAGLTVNSLQNFMERHGVDGHHSFTALRQSMSPKREPKAPRKPFYNPDSPQRPITLGGPSWSWPEASA